MCIRDRLTAGTVSTTVGEAVRRSSENLQAVLGDFKDDAYPISAGVTTTADGGGSAIKALERTGTAFDEKAIAAKEKPAASACCVLQ